MTEPTNAGNGEQNNGAGAGTNPQNGGDGKGGAAPSQNATQPNQNAQATTFDPSKISDEDYGKIFDDPRTFQHSRFKELTEAQKKLKEYEANEAKRQEDELKKKGEFEQLAQKREQEALTLKEQLKNERVNNSLLASSTKLGVIDPEAVLKLIDRGAISVDDTTGTVTGAEEALKKLIESKPYLAGKQGTQRLGSPSNPGNQNTGDLKRFKHSQIQDPVFYRENEKDILASMKAGLIENDL